ncbi:GNAT family N-acetyltransferase [Noviherbaspirillum album]|uniref:GNAT family N-acetyltransferase n=1 Tax=Noviherbaspirillum album TaxID=3080276 RepID=UPI00345FA6D3
MCVIPHSQRTGLGKRLLDSLVKEVADRDNIIAIYLLTNRDVPAASFYSKHHFAASPKKVVMGVSVRSILDAKSA